MQQRVGFTALVALAAVAIPTTAMCATLLVANTGSDDAACGPVAPCRSISRAVANAAPGDTIEVGPGLYGDDLDNDGILHEPGDEPFGGISITKPVEIISDRGASTTLIRAGGIVVFIQTGNVTFGRLNRGFTIDASDNAIVMGGSGELVNVTVGGNVIVINPDPGFEGAPGILAAATRGRIEHNRITAPNGCFAGIFLAGSKDLVSRNVVMGCRDGFAMQDANGARLINNAAIGNSFNGFTLSGTITEFTGNIASDNEFGVTLAAPMGKFRGNSFAANRSHCGVRNFSDVALIATHNYWGAATGPFQDQGDTICEGPAVVDPFLTSDPTTAQSALR